MIIFQRYATCIRHNAKFRSPEFISVELKMNGMNESKGNS